MCHYWVRKYESCPHKELELDNRCEDWKVGRRGCKERRYKGAPLPGACPECGPQIPTHLARSKTEPAVIQARHDFVTEWEQQTGGKVRVLDGRAGTWSSISSSGKDRHEEEAGPGHRVADTRAAEMWNPIPLTTIQERSEGSEPTDKGKNKENRLSENSQKSDEGGIKGVLKGMLSLGRKKSSAKITKSQDTAISTGAANRSIKESEKGLSPLSPRSPIEFIYRDKDGKFVMNPSQEPNHSQGPDQLRDPNQSRWSTDTDDERPGAGMKKSLSNPPKAGAERHREEPRTSAPELGQGKLRDSGERHDLEPSPLSTSTSLETGKDALAGVVGQRRIERERVRSLENGVEDATRSAPAVASWENGQGAGRQPQMSDGQYVEDCKEGDVPTVKPPALRWQKRSIEEDERPAAEPYPSHRGQPSREHPSRLERSLSKPERGDRERQQRDNCQDERPRGEPDRRAQNPQGLSPIPHSTPRVRQVQDVYPSLVRSQTISNAGNRERIQAEKTRIPGPRLRGQQTEGTMTQPRIKYGRRKQETRKHVPAPLSPRFQGQPSQDYPPNSQRGRPTGNREVREGAQKETMWVVGPGRERRRVEDRQTVWPRSEPERGIQKVRDPTPVPLIDQKQRPRDYPPAARRNQATTERTDSDKVQEEYRSPTLASNERPRNEPKALDWSALAPDFESRDRDQCVPEAPQLEFEPKKKAQYSPESPSVLEPEDNAQYKPEPLRIEKQAPAPTPNVDEYFGGLEDFENRKRLLKPEEQCGVDYPEEHCATTLSPIQTCSTNQGGNPDCSKPFGNKRPSIGSVTTMKTNSSTRPGNLSENSSEFRSANAVAGPICGGTKHGNSTKLSSSTSDGPLKKAVRPEKSKEDQEEKSTEGTLIGLIHDLGIDGDVREEWKGVMRMPSPPVQQAEPAQDCMASDEKSDKKARDGPNSSARVVRFFPQKRKPLKDRKAKPTKAEELQRADARLASVRDGRGYIKYTLD